MIRVLPDTGVLVEVLRHREAAEALVRCGWLFRLSAVVHAELLRGADTRAERAYVAQLARTHPPLAPTPGQWERCGLVLARLRREQHFDPAGLRAIQNDVLIALTARGAGCPVVTTDLSDFNRIASLIRGLRVVPWPLKA